MKQKVVNLNKLAQRMAMKSSFDIQDMQRLFKQLTNEVELALEKGEKVKFGKLFILNPQQTKAHSHYDPINDKYVNVDKHLTYKLIKLQRLKNIENKH